MNAFWGVATGKVPTSFDDLRFQDFEETLAIADLVTGKRNVDMELAAVSDQLEKQNRDMETMKSKK
jgi:hypothetical protein